MGKQIVFTKQGCGQSMKDAILLACQAQNLDTNFGSPAFQLADHYYDFFVNNRTSESNADLWAWYQSHYDRVAAGNFGTLDQGLVAAAGYVTPPPATPKKAPATGKATETHNGKATVTDSRSTGLGGRAARLGGGLPALPPLPGGVEVTPQSSSATSYVVPAVGLAVLLAGGFYLWSR